MPGAFIQFEVLIDDDIIQSYKDLAQEYPVVARRAYRGEIERVMGAALTLLKQEPGPPHYPIRWKSERQRRAFFATEGFGRGIPASRSQPPTVLEGWELVLSGTGFDMQASLGNDVPWARYVQGDDAQPFHLDTGYVQAAPVFVQYEALTMDALINTWYALWEFKKSP